MEMKDSVLFDVSELIKLKEYLYQSSPLFVKRIKKTFPDCCEEHLINELCKFLLLTQLGETLTPSAKVDEVWHELILFTRLYHDFCMKYFGNFIHHQPDENQKLNNQRYLLTIELLNQRFGNVDKNIWPHGITAVASCGLCTN
jgi:hypothetical protein